MAFNILVVDDSPAMRAFIGRSLQVSGLEIGECFEAENGEVAINLLREHWVDVILTDINMPRMNGEQLVHCLSADDLLRSIPVLVVSTDGTESRIQRMRTMGAVGYVKKPFSPETLRQAVESALEGVYAAE
jgi:two-component system, chemotaxis family, chemotaxis protein CheY